MTGALTARALEYGSAAKNAKMAKIELLGALGILAA